MIATLALIVVPARAPQAAVVGRCRSVRRDKPKPAARRLSLAGRHFGIAEHEIELPRGVVIVFAFERERAERERGRAPIRSACGRERSQRGFALLLLGRYVHTQKSGAQAGAVPHERIDRAVAGDGVEGGDRALRILGRLSAGCSHLRERPIAARPLSRDLVETGLGFVGLAVFKRGQRLLELVAGRLRGLLPFILPITKAGRSEHDQHGGGQDLVLVFFPEFRRLVAPDFLVNFLKDVAHYARDLSQRLGESERGGRQSIPMVPLDPDQLRSRGFVMGSVLKRSAQPTRRGVPSGLEEPKWAIQSNCNALLAARFLLLRGPRRCSG